MIDETGNVEVKKVNMEGVPEQLVFGLDIGTRSIVGTIGYRDTKGFTVVAQTSKEHETRAMMDGQIHDINMVASTISEIRDRLEYMTGRTYKDVCIAAAGRVLKTVEAEAEIDFNSETVVTTEKIYTLDMLGVENAYEKLREEQNSDDIKFYCVGYSVKHYYQNGYAITNLEGHKCNKISCEIIATFLPDEVVDGLYTAVERAGLYVANLTLEPIAAINVAIPERFRLLNIALVDVGAGTSDISITKDGSIIAYGMIPSAGDEITECLAKHYLTDFNEADALKCKSTEQEEVEFNDIMGLPYKISSDEIADVVKDAVQSITKSIAGKIIELNGGKSVSAVFVVGGGGKIRGFVESLAEFLELPKERVALRGSEVMGNINFMQDDIKVDSLLVTPVGICLNYYEQRNNFIFVNINDERVKLYDNGKLAIIDAAMSIGFPNEDLFPKRGKSIIYNVNGEKRMARGKHGEACVIKMNGAEAGINTPVIQNAKIDIKPSTVGEDAVLEIEDIPDYKSTIKFTFNNKEVVCPRYVAVNGELVSGFYDIKDGDDIWFLGYYTLKQVLEFMDIIYSGKVYVNNVPADMNTKVYDNFSILCEIKKEEPNYNELYAKYGEPEFPTDVVYSINEIASDNNTVNDKYDSTLKENIHKTDETGRVDANEIETHSTGGETAGEQKNFMENIKKEIADEKVTVQPKEETASVSVLENGQPAEKENAVSTARNGRAGVDDITITVNGDTVIMKGKERYILVDVLDFYPVDTSVAHGDHLETMVNGVHGDFMTPVNDGDAVVIQWVV